MTIYEDPMDHPDDMLPIEATPPAEVDENAAEKVIDLQRALRIMLILGLLGIALMVWLWINSSGTADQIDNLEQAKLAQQELIDKLSVQLDLAIEQGADVAAPEVVAAQVPDAEVSPISGAQGERGESGLPGEPGTPGLPGVQGSSGPQGEKGEKGDTGLTGSPGAPGIALDGQDGADGATGPRGDVGPTGAQGDPGPKGDTGATGGMPSTYVFNFNGISYTCNQSASNPTAYNCQPT